MYARVVMGSQAATGIVLNPPSHSGSRASQYVQGILMSEVQPFQGLSVSPSSPQTAKEACFPSVET